MPRFLFAAERAIPIGNKKGKSALPLRYSGLRKPVWTPEIHEVPIIWNRGLANRETGAGNESRTRDLNLGKVALYQLSYSREKPTL